MAVELGTERKNRFLKKFDPEIAELLECEAEKQKKNHRVNCIGKCETPPLSTCLEGSIFTNKKIQRISGKRYVGGTEREDKVELLAIERLKNYLDVTICKCQSGIATIANSAVFMGLLKPGGYSTVYGTK